MNELANYGEYSGAPSEQQTYDYAKTILSLMTREKHPEGEGDTAIPKLCLAEKPGHIWAVTMLSSPWQSFQCTAAF